MPYKDPLKKKEYHRRWHFSHRDIILIKQKEYRLKRKIEALKKYSSGKVECSCCREQTVEFLSIDHTNGGGTSHRRSLNSTDIYAWLLKNNYPGGFRVLCHNCNQAIGHYGKCPHKRV